MLHNKRSNILDRSVLTMNRGVISEREIVPGDKLIEYTTNKPIEVLEIKNKKYDKLFGVKFTDLREEIFTEDELIYGFKYLFHPQDLIHHHIGWTYPTMPVAYPQKINEPKEFAYEVGALWAYGKFDDPYINMPINRIEKNNSILNNMDCIIQSVSGDKAYFAYKGSYSEEPLKWADLFPYYNWYEDHISDPYIPVEYAYSSYHERLTFLRGIFDYGYNVEVTPDTLSINHWSYDRLKHIQWLMWSMGILTNIMVETKLTDVYQYRLNVIGEWANKPTLFNDVNFISQMLSEPNRVLHRTLPEELRIMAVYELKPFIYNSCDYVPVFKTSNEHDVYYSGQFLPRVTN